MSQQKLRSYRLTSLEEPTDEMPYASMEQVAEFGRFNSYKYKTFFTSVIIVFMALLSSCAPSKYTSTIVGSEYKADKDVTDYFVLPLGQVSLPGKWEKGDYVSSSNQQFFHNQDSVIVAIGFTNSNKYEFNAKGLLNGYEFVKAFYDWELDYFSSLGLEAKIIESDQSQSYIIWRLFGQQYDTYFLVGERNGHVSNYSISITDKWTVDQKIQFLKSIYLE